MKPIPLIATPIPSVTAAQMAEVDRRMEVDYRVGLRQMMESAGRNLAHLARLPFLGGDPRGARVMVLAGKGGNGGGALVCGRRLQAWGARVDVLKAWNGTAHPVVDQHLQTLQRMRVPLATALPQAADHDLLIDGLIGYSLAGAPRGPAQKAILWANASGLPTLALDLPSGLDATSGEPLAPTVEADATMTLALPKTGLLTRAAGRFVGELYLADIGVPPTLYDELGLVPTVGPLFALGDIVRLPEPSGTTPADPAIY